MTQQKKYIVSFVSTAVFAVLSLILMFIFKVNEEYFDAHGRLGNLAQTEQQTMILETTKAISYKRNISVVIDDRQEKRLVLPVKNNIAPADIYVREEFTSDKIVLTLKNASELIENNTKLITDSSVMDAVGLYKQDDDVVLEIYEKSPYGFAIYSENNEVVIDFKPLNEIYNYIAVIYIPFEQKERLYSEDWISQIANLVGEKGKVFITSSMLEHYTKEQVLDFVNKVNTDILLEIDYEDTNQPEYMEITYNKDYFIPELSSAQLAILERKYLEEKTNLNVAAYIEADENEILIKNAETLAVKATLFIQTSHESIEEKYKLNHNVMEAILAIFKEIYENRQEIQ